MTTDLHQDMTKAVEAQIKQLAHIRRIAYLDAAVAVAASCAENLRDSRETSMASYWQAMVGVADGIVTREMGN